MICMDAESVVVVDCWDEFCRCSLAGEVTMVEVVDRKDDSREDGFEFEFWLDVKEEASPL